MEKDRETRAVTHMDEHEIDLFLMYRNQLAVPGGRTRDNLPYTREFDNLRNQYNQQVDEPLDHRELWNLLQSVLKFGQNHIELYLQSRQIPVPARFRQSNNRRARR